MQEFSNVSISRSDWLRLHQVIKTTMLLVMWWGHLNLVLPRFSKAISVGLMHLISTYIGTSHALTEEKNQLSINSSNPMLCAKAL